MPDFPLPFIDYTPPTGGLRRLQQSLTHEVPVRASWAPRFVGAAACALAIGVLCLAPGWWAQQQRDRQLTAALQQALTPQHNSIEVTNGAAIALPSGQSNVRLYLVQSLP